MLLYQGTQPGRSQGANTANQGFFLQSLPALVFEKGGQASELSTNWDGKPQIGDRWLMNRAMLSIGMHHKKWSCQLLKLGCRSHEVVGQTSEQSILSH